LSFYDNCQLIKNIHRSLKTYKNSVINTRAVRFQKFYLRSGSGFFGKEKKTSVRFGFGYFQKRRTVQMYKLIYVCFRHFY
jgi:hypothetical protein